MRELLSVLQCPQCYGRQWAAGANRVSCRTCGRAHAIKDGVLTINVLDQHEEVTQERASVPATEMTPALGGWKEAYTPATELTSELARAYLSLPYGNESPQFQEPGYFQNVRRFAPEFDFILRHLPHRGLLLDLGADGTWSTARLAKHGLTCIALDITDHLLLAHLYQTACPPYALVNVDMHESVFVDDAFDAVTAFNAMHHSKRLDVLARNIARMLKEDAVLGFVEPYVQNPQQEAAFGAPQSALGINENVHTIDRWHQAFTAAGLALQVFSLSDSFNAVYRKQAPEPGHLLDTFYHSAIRASPASVETTVGSRVDFVVTVESRGRAAWASRGPEPVRLSFHLSRVQGHDLVMIAFDNERTLLPSFVCPGSPDTFVVPLALSEPGTYEIEFDLVHEARSWFKDRGGQTARARVTVRS